MKPYQSLVMTGRKSLTTCSILLVIDRNNESLAMVAPFVMSAANLGMHPIRLARVKIQESIQAKPVSFGSEE